MKRWGFMVVGVGLGATWLACVGEEAPTTVVYPDGGGGDAAPSDGSSSLLDQTTNADVVETTTVTGKVVAEGQPVANVPIVVGGKPTMTSAVGTFTMNDVKAPYDVAFALGNPANVTVYKGLTRPDPTLVAFGDSGPVAAKGRELQSVNGTVTGGGPYPPNAVTVTVSGPTRAKGIATANPQGYFVMEPLAIAGPLSWVGPSTTTVGFHAHAVINGVGYYGKRDGVAVTDQGNPGSQQIAMNQVNRVDVMGNVTGPASFTDPNAVRSVAGVRFTADGGGYDFPIGNGALPRDGTAKVHEVTGALYFVEASYNRLRGDAEQSFARKAASTAANKLAVTLPEPARPTAPDDASKDVTNATKFEITAFQGGIQRVTFYATGQPTVTVVTKDTTLALPDLSSFGTSLPKNVLYSWRVFGYAPLGSVDDAKLAEILDAPDGTLPPLVDVRAAAATPRVFTTAP